jgi:hypothetical protein
MSDQQGQEVLKASPGIAACAFGNCPWLSDNTLIAWRCSNVTNTGALALVIGQGAKLREIQLIYCKQLDGAVVLAIAEHCPLLEKVACPSGTSDAAVARLAQGCPQLSYVNIGESRVVDAGLTALSMHCVKLKDLNLYKCRIITTQSYASWLSAAPVWRPFAAHTPPRSQSAAVWDGSSTRAFLGALQHEIEVNCINW